MRKATLLLVMGATVVVAVVAPMAFAPVRHSVAMERATAAIARVQQYSYGWPVKPFDREHPVRGVIGEPRTFFLAPPTLDGVLHGGGTFSFHQGIDIAAPDGTAVYPVMSGVVTEVHLTWISVDAGNGHAFAYWHIRPLVAVGDHVTVDKTVLGHILREEGHVHLTEYEKGRVTNPLATGHIGPYTDRTAPEVAAISFRKSDTGRDLLPNFIRGRVELVALAYDKPTMPVPGLWHTLPTTPALLTWRIQLWTGKVVVHEHVAFDHRSTVPPNSAFWNTYARGTYQNMSVFMPHYSYLQAGCYLFKLTRQLYDTRTIRDGVYDLVVTATDIRRNSSSRSQRFTVHNRPGWVGGSH